MYREPRFDEMMAGEIYAAEGGMGMAPSYHIPQPRSDVQSILDESGYSDFMMQKEAEKRKKHIENIKRITGVKKVEGEEQYTRAADPQKAKQWESTNEMDKMMVTAVAKGDIQPEDYRKQKMEQEKQLMNTLEFIAKDMLPKGRGAFRGEPMTPENIRKFTEGGDIEMVQKAPPPITQRHITSGGGRGRGAGGGAGGLKQPGRQEKVSTITQKINKLMQHRQSMFVNTYDKESNPVRVVSPGMKKQYQDNINQIASLKVAESLEALNVPTNKAQLSAQKIMDTDFVEEPGGPQVVNGVLNISNATVLRGLIRAARKPEDNVTASIILQKIKEELGRRGPGPWKSGYQF